jgi:hypothetical protein
MNHRIFYKYQLEKMNYDKKYGMNWIKNLNNIDDNTPIKIYPTGNNSINSGKIYIAFPAYKKLTQNDIKIYNIL